MAHLAPPFMPARGGSFPLAAYLARLGLDAALAAAPPTPALLAQLMAAQSRAVPFENLDVVLRRPVSMHVSDVAAKLLGAAAGAPRRGGYCFELNALLGSALAALGFGVEPLLCRVRWNKAPGEVTAFTHLALRVTAGAGAGAAAFLADVGFAGTNSLAPVPLGGGASALPEGAFRAAEGATAAGYTTLQWQVRGEWRDLYAWRTGEAACQADLEAANFLAHAQPQARFVNEFFAARAVGEAGARHCLVNGWYRVRAAQGGEVLSEEAVRDGEHLAQLLGDVFGIDAPAGAVEAWERAYRRRAQ
jgi:N-hydroxyarylamine O-acetyltransferase